MHKHLKKGVTAALVAGGLVGLAAQPAHADSLLFPYLNTSAGVYSFVTIVNDGLFQNSTIVGYHLTYGHKANPVVQRAKCNHFDISVSATPRDMMTYEVGGKVLDGGDMVLFESAPPVTSSGLLPLPAGQTAFMIAEPLGAGADDASNVRVWGWAEVIDTVGNLNLAYSTDTFSSNTDVDPNFTNLSGSWTAWSWYPTTMVTTSWHVLPLGLRSAMSPPITGGIRGGIEAWDGNPANAGAYDRDERFLSGGLVKTIRCFAIVNRANLLAPAVVSATDGGGWMYEGPASVVVTTPALDPDDPGATYNPMGDHLVHKIQAATAATGMAPRMTINREPSWDNVNAR